jgi:hypothetical protein
MAEVVSGRQAFESLKRRFKGSTFQAHAYLARALCGDGSSGGGRSGGGGAEAKVGESDASSPALDCSDSIISGNADASAAAQPPAHTDSKAEAKVGGRDDIDDDDNDDDDGYDSGGGDIVDCDAPLPASTLEEKKNAAGSRSSFDISPLREVPILFSAEPALVPLLRECLQLVPESRPTARAVHTRILALLARRRELAKGFSAAVRQGDSKQTQ